MALPAHATFGILALLLGGAANVCLGDACPNAAEPVALGSAQWNGWGRSLDNARYQPEPAIRASDVPKLALKWAFGYSGGTEFGQPTVVDGRLFVTSSAGRIYSLDAKTGCTYWTFDTAAGTRTAISIGEFAPPRSAAAPKYAPAPRRKHGGSRSKLLTRRGSSRADTAAILAARITAARCC